MEERLRVYLWLLIGASGFGAIGAGFGALARVHFLASGRVSGGPLGAAAVRAWERLTRQELTPTARSALSGGIDGAAFLGVLGGLFGAHLGATSPDQASILFTVLLGTLLLALGAAAFGGVGYLLARAGIYALGLVFLGSVIGAVSGFWLDGKDGLIMGILAGGLVGIGLARGGRPPSEAPPPDTE
jgi:hypothetical protein